MRGGNLVSTAVYATNASPSELTGATMDRIHTEMSLRRSSHADDRDALNSSQQYERRRHREIRPGGDYCPTPEEIAAECRKIQSEWSERERWRRAGYAEGRPAWEVPTYELASLSAP
jgi:hypothetical protein